jgi:7-carboxy-7-deazaguanine synthase (Cx14CxxC type)
MTYSVKEIFYTLQGEGAQAGRAAVFCRFSGCNLWSGIEKDRNSAICRFCDTDFIGTNGTGGGKFIDHASLADAIDKHWPTHVTPKRKYVVCTGGEPLLQIDTPLIEALHKLGFEVAIETNGTIIAPFGIDWICVSPKMGAPLKQNHGQELKLVFPQEGISPDSLENLQFDHFFIQPMDGPDRVENTNKAIKYCQENPNWRLSIQSHKIIGIR